MPIYQCDTVTVERDRDGSVFLKLDVPGKSVNVFDKQVLFDLDVALDHILAESKVPILIIRSGKPSGFVAGADINEFTAIRNTAEAEALSATGQQLFDKLARLPMPTVAMISGPCLGGGLELALACDYRVVFDKPGTQLGLPEVELGLLPGWGGTQRLPRVIGLERALKVILAGKRLDAREAFDWGLSDARPGTEAELRETFDRITARAIRDGKVDRDRLPLWTWRQRFLESSTLGRHLLFRGAERILRKKTWDDLPAPGEALEVVHIGLRDGMKAGLAAERSAVGRLAISTACRNLVGLFLAREKARKIPSETSKGRSEVQRVGIVGAGLMGAGIAQLAALKGCQVVVQEVNKAALDAGMMRIAGLVRKAVERGIVSSVEAERRLAATKGTINWDGFADLDVVVEAAVEDLSAKRAIFRELETRTRITTVLATNTSSLPVAALQEGLSQPERVAGMHFFNPVHKMPLVEVAKAPATGDSATSLLARWAVTLGKTPVLVKDSPGFVVNRILMPYLNEAMLLVSEGMKITDIDHTMRRFGMPMGPLELLDQIGLDVATQVARSMDSVLANRFPPNDALEKMRVRGWLGHKSSRGFYTYRGKKAAINPAVQKLLRSPGALTFDRALPPMVRLNEARERMVLLMVNEAALVMSEGLTVDAGSLDLAMVLGTGWAPHRGGPLHYADDRGLSDVVQKLEDLASRHGRRFEPCTELRRRLAANEPFTRQITASVS